MRKIIQFFRRSIKKLFKKIYKTPLFDVSISFCPFDLMYIFLAVTSHRTLCQKRSKTENRSNLVVKKTEKSTYIVWIEFICWTSGKKKQMPATFRTIIIRITARVPVNTASHLIYIINVYRSRRGQIEFSLRVWALVYFRIFIYFFV